ncbi:unnamed protein product [Miscanthus lutarioriparius]|uniref:F-box associated beta-propeller type 3 domain-containing protein n=1 Tax=Miscanthus lutarioriparius TaxID=422564 RepID=A0A811S7C1_9POAL|nr:unnamed protein product [Miscanthus lutarioriparius]
MAWSFSVRFLPVTAVNLLLPRPPQHSPRKWRREGGPVATVTGCGARRRGLGGGGALFELAWRQCEGSSDRPPARARPPKIGYREENRKRKIKGSLEIPQILVSIRIRSSASASPCAGAVDHGDLLVWRDLIADPDNRKKLPPSQGLFVETSEVSEVDDDESDVLERISFSFIDLTEMTGIKTFILDSCNGLILFGHRQEPSDPLYYTVCNPTTKVCNPTTKQWSVVYTYLAFAPALSSHFHLVQFQMPDLYEEIVALHVYSSETGTWSQNQIDEQKEQGQLEGWHHQFTLDRETLNHLCAFVNGFLHVIVSHSDLQHILVVDVQGKARRMIPVPGMADGRPGHAFVCYLGQSKGHLHCVTKKNEKLSTGVLQDYDTHEWVLKNTVNSLDVFGETGRFLEFQVVDIHQDCNVVFFLHDYCKLTAYDMDHLRIFKCFFERQPVVDIVAPSLQTIDWADGYDPSSVQLGELAQLRILSTLCFADALPECQYKWGIVMLLRRFWKIPALFITIIYPNPQDWKTEELCLNSLQELHICGLSGADHDLAFVKQLLGWTPVLKTVTINFDPSVTDEEL